MPSSASLIQFTVPLNTGQSPSAQGLLMPKLMYRWSVSLIGFGTNNDTTPITLQASKFNRPSVDFEAKTIDIYNSKVKYAGKYTWSETELTLRDDAQGTASLLVGQQIQKQFDFNQQSSASSGIDYKFQTIISVLDGGNGDNTPVDLETWNLYGCWLSKASYGALDYASSDPMMITLSINFDNALQSPLTAGVGFPVTRTLGTIAV